MQTYTKSSTLYVWRNNCAINRSLNWEQNKVYSSPNSLSCKVDINAIFPLKANSLSNALWPLDILGIVKLFISCIFKHNNLLNYYKWKRFSHSIWVKYIFRFVFKMWRKFRQIFVNKTICKKNVYISPVRTRFWKIYCLILFLSFFKRSVWKLTIVDIASCSLSLNWGFLNVIKICVTNSVIKL